MAACIRSNQICFFFAHSEWLLMTIFALFIVPIYLPDDVSSVFWYEYMNVSVSVCASLYLFIFYLMISLSETHAKWMPSLLCALICCSLHFFSITRTYFPFFFVKLKLDFACTESKHCLNFFTAIIMLHQCMTLCVQIIFSTKSFKNCSRLPFECFGCRPFHFIHVFFSVGAIVFFLFLYLLACAYFEWNRKMECHVKLLQDMYFFLFEFKECVFCNIYTRLFQFLMVNPKFLLISFLLRSVFICSAVKKEKSRE